MIDHSIHNLCTDKLYDYRRAWIQYNVRQMKNEILSSDAGQEMVADKLAEAEDHYGFIVRQLRALKQKAATCPDSEDWLYAWLTEQLEGSKEYRGLLKLARAKVWRWRMAIRMDGMVEVTNMPDKSFDLEAIKQVPIDSLISYSPSFKGGNRWMYKCAVHNESTASMVVYIDQNSWWCFGCNQGGSVIDLVSKMENISFVEACEKLQQYHV